MTGQASVATIFDGNCLAPPTRASWLTEEPAAGIADRIGYTSPSHFTARFREASAITPRDAVNGTEARQIAAAARRQ
ncbi:helix-turn-helix transcriptional regulator [Nocardia rhizosphaerihabitans]|uniref:helix-turn-helix transcriptional regulator n=1 Tax=Nocardia rhizosphaerihabitans TaxID=1691570 RepID=UPI001663EBA8|nr:helix-turn-helix transcriptional regulator [Nocardia rhizosphaerihabitans]